MIVQLDGKQRAILDRLEVESGDDVIASSPWVRMHDFAILHRIVMRATDAAWIVHLQVIGEVTERAYYGVGNHFDRTPETFVDAWRCFVDRSANLLRIPVIAPRLAEPTPPDQTDAYAHVRCVTCGRPLGEHDEACSRHAYLGATTKAIEVGL